MDYNNEVHSHNFVVFTDGIRLDFFKERTVLKSKARKIIGKDSVGCYGFDSFYILPVIVNFKEYKDYEPSICKKHYYIIKTNEGKEVWFSYFSTAATITKVNLLPKKGAKVFRGRYHKLLILQAKKSIPILLPLSYSELVPRDTSFNIADAPIHKRTNSYKGEKDCENDVYNRNIGCGR